MRTKGVLTVFTSWVIIALSSIVAAHEPPSSPYCSAAGPPERLEGNLASPDTAFRWQSDAAQLASSLVCFDRMVENKHAKNRLIFTWPVAGMDSIEGVPAGGLVRYNATLPAVIDVKHGPLRYGAGQSSIPTSVYREKEGKTSRTFQGRTRYTVSTTDKNGKPASVDFIVSTAVGFQNQQLFLSYAIQNLKPDTLYLGWNADRIPTFGDALNAYKRDRPDLTFDVPYGMKIEKGSGQIRVPAKETGILATSILVYSPQRNLIAVVPYVSLFPLSPK